MADYLKFRAKLADTAAILENLTKNYTHFCLFFPRNAMATKSERFGEVDVSCKIQDGRHAAIFYRTELKMNRGRKSPKMNTLAKFWADRTILTRVRAYTTRTRGFHAQRMREIQDGRRIDFLRKICAD